MTRYLAARIRSKDGGGKELDKAILFAEFSGQTKATELQARVFAKLRDRDAFPQLSQTGEVGVDGTFRFAHATVHDAFRQLADIVQSPPGFVPRVSPLPVDWTMDMDELCAPFDAAESSRFTVTVIYVVTDKPRKGGAAKGDEEETDVCGALRELASYILDQSVVK
jgi:hypothetical protein